MWIKSLHGFNDFAHLSIHIHVSVPRPTDDRHHHHYTRDIATPAHKRTTTTGSLSCHRLHISVTGNPSSLPPRPHLSDRQHPPSPFLPPDHVSNHERRSPSPPPPRSETIQTDEVGHRRHADSSMRRRQVFRACYRVSEEGEYLNYMCGAEVPGSSQCARINEYWPLSPMWDPPAYKTISMHHPTPTYSPKTLEVSVIRPSQSFLAFTLIRLGAGAGFVLDGRTGAEVICIEGRIN
ncbi:hypothetical protein BGW80DRAFT_1248646 [Lactifluus volemus]|nr:hypothetical protein BGW80DRAFT_1248646 [Lactifluus volemus]